MQNHETNAFFGFHTKMLKMGPSWSVTFDYFNNYHEFYFTGKRKPTHTFLILTINLYKLFMRVLSDSHLVHFFTTILLCLFRRSRKSLRWYRHHILLTGQIRQFREPHRWEHNIRDVVLLNNLHGRHLEHQVETNEVAERNSKVSLENT